MEISELRERQGWSLEKKIDHSLGVIEDFYAQLDGKVAVSFSGGKDSTVLLWLARKVFPDMKGVFCNTGNEYPDIVKFVRGVKEREGNIDIIYPKMKPKEVISTYGFPLISKETSQRIWYAKHKPDSQVAKIGRGEIGGANMPFRSVICI
jgi:3'-phosphoadenosine 5'-phosphosulfate sulfotransferase (PAPS reductase)/FAD synthetase